MIMRLPKAFLEKHGIVDVVVRRKVMLNEPNGDGCYRVDRAIITFSSGQVMTVDVDRALIKVSWWRLWFFKSEVMLNIGGMHDVEDVEGGDGSNSKGL